MFKTSVACCGHPTTAVFVDDDKCFLDNVLLELDGNISARAFTGPTQAIEYLKNHALGSFVDRYLKSLKDVEEFEGFNSSSVEHGYIDIDIFSVHKEIYNPNRFSAVTVVVVDYTMPEMNGLEFCEFLKELPFKFVLLTGDATISKTIEAFNAGLIHQFIAKSSPDFINKLQNIIYELQEKQFVELSDIIIKNLAVSKAIGLRDPLFVEFLKNYFKENRVVEYYLINESGCFLMADLNGDLSWLVIKSEDEMAGYTSIAMDNYGSKELINQLQSREKILFFYTEEEHVNVTVDGWESHLYPATKLVGKNNTYYYSHIKKIANHQLMVNKITPYAEFLLRE